MKSVIGWTANWRHATNTNLLLIASHSSFVCEKPTMENQLRKIIFVIGRCCKKWIFIFDVMSICGKLCGFCGVIERRCDGRASCHIIKYISFEISRWFGVEIPFQLGTSGTFDGNALLLTIFFGAFRFYSIYENLDVGSHIHNNRSTEELCKFRFAIIRGVCTVFVRFLSAFATWQNKSIIIVCHWNIVNFHQSHKTNGTTHRDNRPFVLWRIRCFGIDNVQCARIEQAQEFGSRDARICVNLSMLSLSLWRMCCSIKIQTNKQKSGTPKHRNGIKKCMFHIKYHTYW